MVVSLLLSLNQLHNIFYYLWSKVWASLCLTGGVLGLSDIILKQNGIFWWHLCHQTTSFCFKTMLSNPKTLPIKQRLALQTLDQRKRVVLIFVGQIIQSWYCCYQKSSCGKIGVSAFSLFAYMQLLWFKWDFPFISLPESLRNILKC